MLAVTIVAAAASRSDVAPLTDSATCSNWTSTPVAQQFAFAQRYVDTHPAPAAASVWDAASVRAALGNACTRAAYLGETDEVSLTAAMHHAF